MATQTASPAADQYLQSQKKVLPFLIVGLPTLTLFINVSFLIFDFFIFMIYIIYIHKHRAYPLYLHYWDNGCAL